MVAFFTNKSVFIFSEEQDNIEMIAPINSVFFILLYLLKVKIKKKI